MVDLFGCADAISTTTTKTTTTTSPHSARFGVHAINGVFIQIFISFIFGFIVLHLIFKYAYANYNGQWIAYAFWMSHFFVSNGMEWYGIDFTYRYLADTRRWPNRFDCITMYSLNLFWFLFFDVAHWVSAPCQRISNAPFIWFVIHSASI